VIYPDLTPTDAQRIVESQLERIDRLAAQLSNANCVILTLGNVVDFFRDDVLQSAPLLEKIFPKFVAMPPSEDIVIRSGAASRLKGKGATLRLASYAETLEAIACCIGGIRAITKAPLIVTLSPVPIDSVIGLSDTKLRSAVEVDCVSKSRLRSAFDDVMSEIGEANAPIHYFPSFEIVRWIAPMLPIPSFGFDDAASRHVSSPILDSVCLLFVSSFIKLGEENAARAHPTGVSPSETGNFAAAQPPSYRVTFLP
jgi:hypothetical protein